MFNQARVIKRKNRQLVAAEKKKRITTVTDGILCVWLFSFLTFLLHLKGLTAVVQSESLQFWHRQLDGRETVMREREKGKKKGKNRRRESGGGGV